MNSKVSSFLCKFCCTGNGVYTCPRCSVKYCSSQCYKHKNHHKCSEQFFREWVETFTGHDTFQRAEKKDILDMISKSAQLDPLPETEEPSLDERFAEIDLDKAEGEVIWNQLTQKEKDGFENLCNDDKFISEIIQLHKAWWEISDIKLVSEIGVAENVNHLNEIAIRPPFPINIEKLSALTSIPPSNCIKYNLVNILYCYAFLFKFYNTNIRDFLDDVAVSIFDLCPVLSKGINYSSLEEAVQDSLCLVTNSQYDISFDFSKSIVFDVCKILRGPRNTQAITYILCALQDIKLIFCDIKQKAKEKIIITNLKKLLPAAIRKVDYFLSWSADQEHFEDLAQELSIIFLSDNLSDANACEYDSKKVTTPIHVSLIEELN